MLQITISNDRQNSKLNHSGGPLEIGRGPQREVERLVIEDRFVSRNQMRLLQIGDQVELENLGAPLTLSDGQTIESGETKQFALPIRLTAGYTLIEVQGEVSNLSHTPSDGLQTIAPPQLTLNASSTNTSLGSLGDMPPPEKIAEWFEALLVVQQAAAGTDEFYQETAVAIVQLIGLDKGMVLRLNDDGSWVSMAHTFSNDRESGRFSKTVLSEVIKQKRTWFQAYEDETDWTDSLMGVESVVASPIFDAEQKVIGAVYGSRGLKVGGRRGITELEAQFLQVLAAAVGVGLIRKEREEEAARRRLQLEQFCSPRLAVALEQDPELLVGNEREVTVAFCDLRGCSKFSEKIGAAKSYELLSDVMDFFTNVILANDGVIIDYYGDGLAAMWNAPALQDDHPNLACKAAIEIVQGMPGISTPWRELLGHDLKCGIGINSGGALVGNAGSRKCMKYGPRGHTVNLTQRVEAATKVFGAPILVTEYTAERLNDSLPLRRIRRIRPKGMREPLSVYQIYSGADLATWQDATSKYHEALEEFEAGRFDAASKIAGNITGDLSAENLHKEAIAANSKPPEDLSGILDMTSK